MVNRFLVVCLFACNQVCADFASQNQQALDFATTGDIMATQEQLKQGIDPNTGGGLGIGSMPCGQVDANGKYYCGGQEITPSDNPPEAGFYHQAPSQLEDAGRMKSVSDETAQFQMNTAIAMPVGLVKRDDPIFQFAEQNENALAPLSQSYTGCATIKGGANSGTNIFKTCSKTGVPNINHCYRSWTPKCTWINEDPILSNGSAGLPRVKETTYYAYDSNGKVTKNASGGTPFYHYTLARSTEFTLTINPRMINDGSIIHFTSTHWVPNKGGCGDCGIPSMTINGKTVDKASSYGISAKVGYHTVSFYNLKSYLVDGDNAVKITLTSDNNGANFDTDIMFYNLYDIKECIKSITENFVCDGDMAKITAKPLVKTLCLDNENPKIVDGVAISRPEGCWRQDEQHGFVGTGIFTEDSQCGQYRAEKCTVLKEDCLVKHPEGWCANAKLTFSCSSSTAEQTVEVCGDTLICPDGNCYDQVKEQGDGTEGFKQVATYTEFLKNVKDNFNASDLSVFKGQYKECSVNKTLIGSDSCCVGGSGTLNTLGKKCNVNEQQIADARNNKIVTFLGMWEECGSKVVGVCVEKIIHYEYCVWPSKLARMLQDQGMPQLGQTITSACRGFKMQDPNEFAAINFDLIDFSEYFADVTNKLNNTPMPNTDALSSQTQAAVPAMADKLNERYKDYGR